MLNHNQMLVPTLMQTNQLLKIIIKMRKKMAQKEMLIWVVMLVVVHH
tara:strand:+ start:967 stop:1107 length:141 start_codon:yes stop_codon:yes gene_type:complete